MNYESELEELFLNELKQQYGLKSDTSFYLYFELRYRIWKEKDELQSFANELTKKVCFLCRELNLPVIEGRFTYKDQLILAGYSLENSLKNIMENWEFRASYQTIHNPLGESVNLEEEIEKEWFTLRKVAKNKGKRHKNSPICQTHLQYIALQELNQLHKANPKPPSILPNISYPTNHNYFFRILEEELEQIIHAENVIRYDNVTFTEKDLQKYLKHNLELVETGLHLIETEYVLPEGRIDLLAVDQNNKQVIIELKNTVDKELVWQCLYYRMALKDQLKIEMPRMIVIAPEYSTSLLMALKQIPEIELYQFSPYVVNGKLKDLQLKLLH